MDWKLSSKVSWDSNSESHQWRSASVCVSAYMNTVRTSGKSNEVRPLRSVLSRWSGKNEAQQSLMLITNVNVNDIGVTWMCLVRSDNSWHSRSERPARASLALVIGQSYSQSYSCIIRLVHTSYRSFSRGITLKDISQLILIRKMVNSLKRVKLIII